MYFFVTYAFSPTTTLSLNVSDVLLAPLVISVRESCSNTEGFPSSKFRPLKLKLSYRVTLSVGKVSQSIQRTATAPSLQRYLVPALSANPALSTTRYAIVLLTIGTVLFLVTLLCVRYYLTYHFYMWYLYNQQQGKEQNMLYQYHYKNEQQKHLSI